jgi:hypothetical protein
MTIPCMCFKVYLYRMEDQLTIQTTYTQARAGLAKLLDQVTHNREVVIIGYDRSDFTRPFHRYW